MKNISQYGDFPTIWTSEELAKWEKIQKEVNAEYEAASEEQLVKWVNGEFTHNEHRSIYAVVDTEDGDRVIKYGSHEGGECCPDFSCCGCKPWPEEKRKKFMELHRSGNEEARTAMLLGALAGITEETCQKAYIAGQIDPTQSVH